ncbi:hypothetical protein DICPUDRAFT_56804 [Dictyostelium purpureum]|uniref:Glutamine amidotransferase domain-containing protein n=1 Tax=Dictyostelium purpureum TaxID=5786 RepID=F0ZT59_DICPU|nr:uncharacterized protein DICPUDRAFT_56804 [Dictyostelium purpureum]EGC32877.1 hypothetical protein DICPUDRAFT_56804 [Dictyostelium purpureum]|eukprot:XP_003290596.1 hypothetical protein DICPUDRAFT_56804 [Dictyostelium purpureum]
MKRELNIAIIVTDEELEAKNFKEFFGLYDNFIKRYGLVDHIKTTRFSAVQKEWPANPLEYDGYVITGSKASAYDKDEWITVLKERVVHLDQNEVKICGICFGHQIIAEALGGKVEKNEKGWELGQHSIQVEESVIQIFSKILNTNDTTKSVAVADVVIDENNINDSNEVATSDNSACSTQAKKDKDFISILQIHQDHVSVIPEGMISIGSTPKSPVQGMLKESKNKPGSYHIISFQGHPEFDRSYISLLINDLHEVDTDFRNEALKSLQESSCQPWLSELVYGFFNN